MGTYGIGVGRTMAAAVEQHHDADGIVWPLALAPFEIALVSLNPVRRGHAARRPTPSTTASARPGLEVFYDDRDERPGVKFKDADLIGFPIRVNVGGRALKEGKVEIVRRRDKELRTADTAGAVEAVAGAARGARRELNMRKMTAEEALEYHSRGRKGKIEVVPSKPCRTQEDLSLAYTPGVAEPCLAIAKDPDKVYEYTSKGNLVAVISNGTAVLGLGDIGPLAGKPVMEGKGVLFKRFADIDVFDIEVDAHGRRRVRRDRRRGSRRPSAASTSRTSSRPECFEIEERLKKRLQIPVFHDDQHGTAIISAAALSERPRDRRQEDRERQGRLLRRGRRGDRLREALPLLRRAAREPAAGRPLRASSTSAGRPT